MNKILQKAFYSPSTGYTSAEKLYKRLKNEYPDIKLKDVKKFVDDQYTTQVNAPIRKPTKFNSIIAYRPQESFQMDIMVYDRYAYHNYKYILVIVDVYSRFARAKAMTNRSMTNIMKNIKEIFVDMGIPDNINCDNEFNTNEFNKYAQDNNIRVHYSQPDELNKNAIVERLNYTISSRLMKWRTATGKYDWYRVLPEIMDNYNSDFHSTIKAAPKDVFLGRDVNHQVINTVVPKFKIGDRVRKRIEKKIFGKNDTLKYSKTIYIIRKIKGDKLYLTNTETNEDLKEYVKPYQVKAVGDIQYIEKQEIEHEPIHTETQRKRKVKRALTKEGVQESHEALRRSARERRPNQLLTSKGERVIW